MGKTEHTPLVTQNERLSSPLNDSSDTDKVTTDSFDKNSNKKTRLEFNKLSARQKYVLILCMIADFFSGCSFAIMAPFYPKEAGRKGMTPTEIGFIFSIFELIIFISSPIIGSNLTRIGTKFVFLSGIFSGGLCTIFFGTLNKCPPDESFVILSFLVRSIQGLGFSSFVTASFAVVSSEFPQHVSTAFGMLQTASGTGLMLGPVIGGALYQLGGFGLPFYSLGVAVLLNGLVIFYFLPNPNDAARSGSRRSVFSLVWRPSMFIPMLSICTGALGITFMEPSLANHLEPFHLSTVVVGLFFVISPLMNSLTSPLWGYLTDTRDIQGPILVSCHFVFAVGFFLIGPCHLLPFLPFKIWVLVLGLVLIGVTFASILITSMKCMVLSALRQGFENNLETYGIIAGFFNSMYTLGGFVGPMLGGILSEKIGPSFGFTLVGLIALSMTVVTFCFFTIRRCRGKH